MSNSPLSSSLGRFGLVAIAVLATGLPMWMATASAAAGPTATMSPNTGLIDLQRTTIRGGGFPAHRQIQVLQCEGTLQSPPRDARACEGDTLDSAGYSDAQGRYVNEPKDPTGHTAGYEVYILPSATLSVVSIRCGPANPCVLYIGVQFTDFSQPHTFISMSFRGAVATASPADHRLPWAEVSIAAVIAVGLGTYLYARRRKPARMSDATS